MTQSRRAALGAIIGSALMLARPTAHAEDKKITLGFAQVGAESAWRTANTVSVKSPRQRTRSINLKFSDAQQKQENQIKAIRSYIAQKVDVIAFSPVVESGWEPVLTRSENREDSGDPHRPQHRRERHLALRDDDRLGLPRRRTPRRQLARRALQERAKARSTSPSCRARSARRPPTTGTRGLIEVIKNDPKFKIIASQSGDFTLAGGKQVMEAFVKTYGNKINVVYAHNDDMALGAIQAMEEAGMQAGQGRRSSSRSMRPRAASRRWSRARSTSTWNAARCSGRN